MARRTNNRTETRTTNELFESRFNGMWGNVKHGSINLRSLRNFAKMCKAIDSCDKETFSAKDLGVSGMTTEYGYMHKIIRFNRTDLQETKTEYQQVDNPDNRIVITRKAKVTYFEPVEGIDYKALAEATEEYVINQIKNI